MYHNLQKLNKAALIYMLSLALIIIYGCSVNILLFQHGAGIVEVELVCVIGV